ncbi:hypothetical protein ACFO9Q_16060 [Paenibacillus sp. GCM10023252]|uniref:hypothetical protein n=1 Tax=Paenibacillus sp. GCM10023252 TaxID=3252649 RepID=UPI00360AD546
MIKSKSPSSWEHVQLAAKLADLKDDHYHTILTLGAMLELLVEKGILSKEELALKAEALDSELESTIAAWRKPAASEHRPL